MSLKPTAILALFTLSFAPTAWAETDAIFDIKLGQKTLGAMAYASDPNSEILNTVLSQTPMGAFDGTFIAESKIDGDRRNFEAISDSSRKARIVLMSHTAGRAVETTVDPVSEMTPLSDPARVPEGIIDPVQAIGKLIAAPDCPDTIAIYDGRRAIALHPVEATVEGGTQICNMSYRVIAGPGHLSPLKISNAKMKLTYVFTETTRELARIEITSGIFKVALDRRH